MIGSRPFLRTNELLSTFSRSRIFLSEATPNRQVVWNSCRFQKFQQIILVTIIHEMTPTYQFMVAVTLLLSFGICDLSYATQNDQPKPVLVLYSHQTSSPINSQMDLGIRSAISKGFPSGVKFEVEHLDSGRTEDGDYGEALQEYLRLKYADKTKVFARQCEIALCGLRSVETGR